VRKKNDQGMERDVLSGAILKLQDAVRA
jgi:hypothetical protein